MNIKLDDLLPQGVSHQQSEGAPKEWSTLQEAIYSAGTDTSDNLLVQAVAGSGKTTTLVELARRVREPALYFLAFNKIIATELQNRLPQGCTAKTFNALGHGMMPRSAKLNAYKDYDITKQHGIPFKAQQPVVQAVEFAKQKALGILDMDLEGFFSDVFLQGEIMIDEVYLEKAPEWALRVFSDSLRVDQQFSFGDQLYYPVAAGKRFPRADVVMVDEAQDLSPIQHLMLERMESRMIAVGDRAQAIYAWRGADEASMDRLREKFQMRELPLSISYRCAQRIVREAQSLVSHIQFSDKAPEGKVEVIEDIPEGLTKDDMIVCRNNAPLMRFCVGALRDKKPIKLLSTVGDDVRKALEKVEGVYTREALKSLEQWRDRELARSEDERRRQKIWDRYHMIEPFLAAYKLKAEAIAALNILISSTTGPIVSTIHRSKGLEAQRVFFLDPGLLGDDGQENNLRYVAITRAKMELYYTGDLEGDTHE